MIFDLFSDAFEWTPPDLSALYGEDHAPEDREWLTWEFAPDHPGMLLLMCRKTGVLGFVLDALPSEIRAVRENPYQPFTELARVRLPVARCLQKT